MTKVIRTFAVRGYCTQCECEVVAVSPDEGDDGAISCRCGVVLVGTQRFDPETPEEALAMISSILGPVQVRPITPAESLLTGVLVRRFAELEVNRALSTERQRQPSFN